MGGGLFLFCRLTSYYFFRVAILENALCENSSSTVSESVLLEVVRKEVSPISFVNSVVNVL